MICDCGEPAVVRLKGGAEICRRCGELETTGVVEHEIIHSLLGGPASLDDLAAMSGSCTRSVDRALQGLLRRGRCSRTLVESENAGGLYLWRLS